MPTPGNENPQMNNFEKLQQEWEDKFNSDHKEEMKSGIWNMLATFRYVGQIIDVYIPKFIKFLVAITGGEDKDESQFGTKGGFVLGSGLGIGTEDSDSEGNDSEDPDNDENLE